MEAKDFIKPLDQTLQEAIKQYTDGAITALELVWFISGRLHYVEGNCEIDDPYRVR